MERRPPSPSIQTSERRGESFQARPADRARHHTLSLNFFTLGEGQVGCEEIGAVKRHGCRRGGRQSSQERWWWWNAETEDRAGIAARMSLRVFISGHSALSLVSSCSDLSHRVYPRLSFCPPHRINFTRIFLFIYPNHSCAIYFRRKVSRRRELVGRGMPSCPALHSSHHHICQGGSAVPPVRQPMHHFDTARCSSSYHGEPKIPNSLIWATSRHRPPARDYRVIVF